MWRRGEERRGEERRGEERRGEERRGEERRGEERRGEARRGEARRGEERRGEEIDMTVYVETWKNTLEERAMRVSRPITWFMYFIRTEWRDRQTYRKDNRRRAGTSDIHQISRVRRGRERRHGNGVQTESEYRVEKREEMQWVVVRQ